MNQDEILKENSITKRKISNIFTREEIIELTKRSDLMGFWAIFSTWLVIVVCFLFIQWSSSLPLWQAIPAIILGVCVLGGRQLALAILTHEGTHGTLFKTKWLNEKFTDWVCARFIGFDLAKYREHHFVHHAKTGTEEDTDISLIKGLPTTRKSLARKFFRDIVGITGLKLLLGRILMDAEIIKWTVATDLTRLPIKGFFFHTRAFVKNFYLTFLTNLLLFLSLDLIGSSQLYIYWIVAYVIPFPLFIRIRALAEHAATKRSLDMFENTRTTKAGFIARSFVAPIRVNYHIEHHVMASVPWFRLKKMHELLRERNIVEPPPGYWHVLNIVSSGSRESLR